MAFEQRYLKRQAVRYDDDNADNPLVYQLQLDGKKQTPTSATIDIYAPGETSKTVDAASMTVDGTLLTYSIDTTTTGDFPVDRGYRAEMAILSGVTTYHRKLVFDVAKFILDIPLVKDQMQNRDDELLAGEHAGDKEMPGVLVATRDDLQLLLEQKAFADEQVTENMVLDEGKLASVAAYYALELYFRGKSKEEKADHYEEKFNTMWDAFTGSIEYDVAGDGFEEEDTKPTVPVRFML